VFARPEIGGAQGSLLVQAIAAFSTLFYSATMTWLILQVLDVFVGLRVSPDQEYEGLDVSQHGEQLAS